MVALFAVMVVDRFVGMGWLWTEEVVRILLVWMVMIGLPVVLYHHEEILLDILVLPLRATRWRWRFAIILRLVFLLILAWQGWNFTARNWTFRSPSLGISHAWIYIPIGAALGSLALLIRDEDRAAAWPPRCKRSPRSGIWRSVVIVAAFLILGKFVEPISALSLVTPMLSPVAQVHGLDPIHFAMVIIVDVPLGSITAPVAIILILAWKIAEVPYAKTVGPFMPYSFIILAGLLVIA